MREFPGVQAPGVVTRTPLPTPLLRRVESRLETTARLCTLEPGLADEEERNPVAVHHIEEEKILFEARIRCGIRQAALHRVSGDPVFLGDAFTRRLGQVRRRHQRVDVFLKEDRGPRCIGCNVFRPVLHGRRHRLEADRRPRRRTGVRMARERNVPNHEAHSPFCPLPLREERLELGVGAPAVRALKIREEYNRHGARLNARCGRDLVTDRQRYFRAAGEQKQEEDEAGDPDHAGVLQRQDAGANEIREALALIVLENAVNLAEGLHDRLAKFLRTLHALVTTFVRARLAEGRAFDGVGECGDGAPLIDLRLRAFDLQLVEDLRELPGLLFRELELVREETKRTADTEVSTFRWAWRPVMTSRTEATTKERALGTRATTGTCVTTSTFRTTGVLPPMNKCRMHVFSDSPGLSRSRRGFTCGRHASHELQPSARGELAHPRGGALFCKQMRSGMVLVGVGLVAFGVVVACGDDDATVPSPATTDGGNTSSSSSSGSSSGEVDAGPTYTLDNVCDKTAPIICDLRKKCCAADYDEAGCISHQKTQCAADVAAVKAGTEDFHPELIDPCIPKFKDILEQCSFSWELLQMAGSTIGECQAFTGKKAVGDACERASECLPSTKKGDLTTCDEKTKKCKNLTFLVEGDACSLKDGTTGLCGTGLYCDVDFGTGAELKGFCKKATSLGVACNKDKTPFNLECGIGNYCDKTTAKCVVGKAAGAACTGPNLECQSLNCSNGDAGVCTAVDPLTKPAECKGP